MLAVFGGARPLLFAAADHQWAAGAGPCKSPGALTERTETHSTTPPGLVSCTVGCQGRARDDQEVAIALPPAQGLSYQRRQPLRSVLAATGAGWASGWESTGNRAAFAGWSRERAGGEAEPSRVDGGAPPLLVMSANSPNATASLRAAWCPARTPIITSRHGWCAARGRRCVPEPQRLDSRMAAGCTGAARCVRVARAPVRAFPGDETNRHGAWLRRGAGEMKPG